VLSVDVTVAAYRFPFLLAGDSVIMKMVSPYYEHFYWEMEPFEHYIPFTMDDLLSRLSDIQSNEAMARKLIENSRRFVNDHLQPVNVFCYYALLIKEYKTKLNINSTRLNDEEEKMEGVRTGDDQCSCRQEHRRHDDQHEEL